MILVMGCISRKYGWEEIIERYHNSHKYLYILLSQFSYNIYHANRGFFRRCRIGVICRLLNWNNLYYEEKIKESVLADLKLDGKLLRNDYTGCVVDKVSVCILLASRH